MGILEYLGLAGKAAEKEIKELRDEVKRLRTDLDHAAKDYYGFRQVVSDVLTNPAAPDAVRQQTALEQMLVRHDLRISKLSQEMTRQRNDLVSADHLQHQEILPRLKQFIQQDLVFAVSGLAKTEHHRALIMQNLSRLLFDRAYDLQPSEELLADLQQHHITIAPAEFSRLRDAATDLKDRANATGHGHAWTLDCVEGAAIDDSSQQLWDGADRDQAVSVVVAPGYRVGDKIYAKQWVFTQPLPEKTPGRHSDGPVAPARAGKTPSPRARDEETAGHQAPE
ncbi:hypothetical protein [Paractinoplanes lichenicola]|uniref:Nucleotide exchange factor GrpE n=1 Tax=Paractinoplanes lichenicola TaxID=2802976 RepID=A0ABS1VG30_9ACTN|nr:hypothetical protein [Actinoplanes lichenicola]MBL7252717.1 hypothetical protein [Actinoplanes lichenicola]